MRKYVFADETGCMTFKKGQNISRYFILCTIVVDNPEAGNELLKLRREMAWQGVDISELHATKDLQEIRNKVFECIKSVNTPPAKAGGFGVRLKAGLIGHSADGCRYVT